MTENVYVCKDCGAEFRTILDYGPGGPCYECGGEWKLKPDELTDVDLRGIPPSPKISFMAHTLLFEVWGEPYGTPASETSWYQKEGYQIAEAIRRHLMYAIWDALDPVEDDLVKLPEGQTEFVVDNCGVS